MSDAKLTPGGYRAADTARLYRIFNKAALTVAEIAGDDDAECVRLLRVLSTMLSESAQACFAADPVAEGERIAADFWERRKRMIDRARGEDVD
jgi:hypothetical protein